MIARDLSNHGKLELRGADRARFLHGMVTNDILALKPGTGCHASMLTVKGKLLGDLVVLCDEDALWIDVDPIALPAIRDALVKHVIMDDVTVEDRSSSVDEIGVYGDGAADVVQRIFSPLPRVRFAHVRASSGLRVAAVHELGRDGFRLWGDHAQLRAAIAATPISDDEAEVLRIEAGEPRFGVDMGEDHLPIESRLDDTISFTKGCYLGQEVIVRATQQGRINRKLVGLRLDGDRPAAHGAKLRAAAREEAGTITSSTVSPRFGSIALGYVHRTVWAPGTELELRDGETTRRAVVCELPFSA